MKRKKKFILLITILICCVFICACKTKKERSDDNLIETTKEIVLDEDTQSDEKGYNLPINSSERKEAKGDLKKIMELLSDIYKCADKGSTSNVVLSEKVISQMQTKIKETKYPVTSIKTYSNMENYKDMDKFLKNCMEGKKGSIVIYEVFTDGGIGRSKYKFDGTDLYVLGTSAVWNEENELGSTHVSYNRIKKWNYTKKGWFCYELCVPEPPEVTEIVDGCCMIRVKPMKKEYQEISEKYLLPVGYQGNNLLCSNWDIEHLENLDYNGIYQYLYQVKYQKNFDAANAKKGIPKKDFENLIMEYLPITSKQIRNYAVFDEEYQTYAWARLGCFNYAPTFFGTSIPEVTNIKENKNGTTTLTVDAVCEMILCEEAIITCELIVQFLPDGSFQYLGNKVLDDGLKKIPDYQYRLRRE